MKSISMRAGHTFTSAGTRPRDFQEVIMAVNRHKTRLLYCAAVCLLLALPAGPSLAAASIYAPGEVERDANGEP
ncbi:hypothetical protein [Hankyongella ginsenosidimutans]|uniref:hypothetical protein n=1 Tax=Hankyongella ginsenosidimutans TaxID=1763828 RepID=UPI003CCC56A1